MDSRTVSLLGVVDGVSASVLLVLLKQPATEAEVVAAIPEANQWTVNRHLFRLKESGLAVQEEGKARARGRLWTVAHPHETTDLMRSLFDLADAVEVADRAIRERARRQLKLAHADRMGLQSVDGES